jgi:hypothetical protein
MTVAIGLRASPTQVTFAIVVKDGEVPVIRAVDVVTVPRALGLPDQLRFIRTTLLDIMEEFDVERAGLKLVENTAPGRHEFRLNLEGVVQELLASSNVDRYFAGRIDRLAALLGEPSRPRVKRYIQGGEVYAEVAEWENYHGSEERESLLAAFAALSNRL